MRSPFDLLLFCRCKTGRPEEIPLWITAQVKALCSKHESRSHLINVIKILSAGTTACTGHPYCTTRPCRPNLPITPADPAKITQISPTFCPFSHKGSDTKTRGLGYTCRLARRPSLLPLRKCLPLPVNFTISPRVSCTLLTQDTVSQRLRAPVTFQGET